MSELSESRLLLTERQTGVGGSDIHHVMNEEPYGCRRRLFYEKVGIEPDYEHSARSQRFMARGQHLEAIAAAEYEHATGRRTRRTGVRRVKEYPHRLVHLDRVIPSYQDPITGAGSGNGALECKVPGEAGFKRIVAAGLPAAYVLQMQWALAVTGHRWGAFAILWADGWELLPFDVAANPELAQALEAAVDAFWQLVLVARDQMARGETVDALRLPDRLTMGDKRCASCLWRRTCWGEKILEALRLQADDKAVALDPAPDLAELVTDLLDAKRLLAEHEALIETIGTQLRDRLGTREAVEVLGHRVYYRLSKPSVGLDMDAIREQMPPQALEWLYATYGKPKKQARPLRIY
jgi:putative phage-type endonuclease